MSKRAIPRRYRSPSVPGDPLAGPVGLGARPERARAGEDGPAALPGGLGAQRHRETDLGRPGKTDAAGRGHGQKRPGGGALRPDSGRLLPHHRPDRGARRIAPRRPRQLGAGRRNRGARRHYAARAHHRHLHDTGRQSRSGRSAHQHERDALRRGLRSHGADEDLERHAADHRQPDRHDDRDGQGASGLRQQERRALPEPVRQHAPAGEDAAGGDAGSSVGHSAKRPSLVRVRDSKQRRSSDQHQAGSDGLGPHAGRRHQPRGRRRRQQASSKLQDNSKVVLSSGTAPDNVGISSNTAPASGSGAP